MKIRSSSVFLIFILVVMFCSTLISISFHNFDATLAPLLLSVSIFILAAIELVKELRVNNDLSKKEAGDQTNEKIIKKSELGRFGSALVWIVGFAVGIAILGFYFGIPIFALIYMKHRGRSLAPSIIFSVLLTFFIYLIFEIGLESHLYRGTLFSAF
jgi:ABC-type sugar transport system permease subunit